MVGHLDVLGYWHPEDVPVAVDSRPHHQLCHRPDVFQDTGDEDGMDDLLDDHNEVIMEDI
jgi:hypothetical protein